MWDALSWITTAVGWISGLGTTAIVIGLLVVGVPFLQPLAKALEGLVPGAKAVAEWLSWLLAKVLGTTKEGVDDIFDSGKTVATVALLAFGVYLFADMRRGGVEKASCDTQLAAVVADYQKRLGTKPRAVTKPATTPQSSTFKWFWE